MKPDLLRILRCPYCGGELEVSLAHPSGSADIEYGILSCACAQYPIVGGIPIIKVDGRVNVMNQTTDTVLNIGPKVKDLVALVREGRFEAALLQLLVVPSPRSIGRLFALSEAAPSRVGAGELRSIGDWLWSRQQRRDREFLLDEQEHATAMQMIRFFYWGSLHSENYHYFACRFGQPRHLAALSLLSILPPAEEPILDLACGFGHLMHYLLNARPGHAVIGLDRNFFQLYVARRNVAPGGEFVCSEADVRLPFTDRSFAGILCSDAFHYFLRRLQCAEEMKRVTKDDGLMILARVGNRAVEPREGCELNAQEYLRLFAGYLTRLTCEEELLQSYLLGFGPQLQESRAVEDLGTRKWLSLVVAKDSSRLRNYGEFGSWPHCVGSPQLNPLYRASASEPAGNVTLKLEFPSSWYEFENDGCLQYMPRTAAMDDAQLSAIGSSLWTEELAPLAKSCVVVGMPERYL